MGAACCRCSRSQQPARDTVVEAARSTAVEAARSTEVEAAGNTPNTDVEQQPDEPWERTDVTDTPPPPQPPVRGTPVQLDIVRRNVDIVSALPTGEDCVICLTLIEEECARTRCGHYFHHECINKYLAVNRKQRLFQDRRPISARCPVCRTSLNIPAPLSAAALSGRRIEVTDVPPVGAPCHFDRHYAFVSLGNFHRPGMFYLLTSNDDRKTLSSKVMWTLTASRDVCVHLNFRSENHLACTGSWLWDQGWKRNSSMQSTVSTGFPNGPYSGPVVSREFPAGQIELMGSNTWEGVYFVFIEISGMHVAGGTIEEPEQTDVSLAVQPTTLTSQMEEIEVSSFGTPADASFSIEDIPPPASMVELYGSLGNYMQERVGPL